MPHYVKKIIISTVAVAAPLMSRALGQEGVRQLRDRHFSVALNPLAISGSVPFFNSTSFDVRAGWRFDSDWEWELRATSTSLNMKSKLQTLNSQSSKSSESGQDASVAEPERDTNVLPVGVAGQSLMLYLGRHLDQAKEWKLSFSLGRNTNLTTLLWDHDEAQVHSRNLSFSTVICKTWYYRHGGYLSLGPSLNWYRFHNSHIIASENMNLKLQSEVNDSTPISDVVNASNRRFSAGLELAVGYYFF